MGIVDASELRVLIDYLRSKDARGVKLLRRHYTPAFYGALMGMLGCPERSSLALEKVFSEIVSTFHCFDQQQLLFFTWAMQLVRKVGGGLNEEFGEVAARGDHVDTAFSLVMRRGFSIAQASRFLDIPAGEVAQQLRLELQKIK